MLRYMGLLKGLNLVQQKSWSEAELQHFFPDLTHAWLPLLDARHTPATVSSERWATLDDLQTELMSWDDPLEATILNRRMQKIAAYFREVEKPQCDEGSLSFFLQDLPLLEVKSQKVPGTFQAQSERMSSTAARQLIDAELAELFPEHHVETMLSSGTLARASTTKTGIRLRADATFTKEDVELLVVHEAWVHLGTNLAGTLQVDLPWLSQWHPGVTPFQEGLALIAEIVTGHWGPEREQQLLLRHEAARLALQGENARQIWQFFLDHGADSKQALESTLRVFRGCSLAGGMCFGKEFQYLLGLHQWLNRRADITVHDMQLAMVGKMDFLEWEMLRSTHLQKKVLTVKSPAPLLRWMHHPRTLELMERMRFLKVA
jgi:hypothetical protein